MVVRRKCCRDTKADERREKGRSAIGHIGYYSAHKQVKQKKRNRKKHRKAAEQSHDCL